MDDITNTMDISLGKLWEMVKDREAWHVATHGLTKSDMTEQLNLTEKNDTKKEAENRSRLTDRENNLILRGGGRDKLGV